VARLAAAAIAKRSPHIVVDELEKQLASGDAQKRLVVLETLAELREPLAVPVLIGVLDDAERLIGSPGEQAQTASVGLKTVTRQDFGQDAHKWYAWWNANSNRHRIEWLIDALDHDSSEVRHGAGEELKALTKEYFGFSSELPTRERQRAQQRYRDWWVTEGRSRFRRR
jgi:HEAT repeat protein